VTSCSRCWKQSYMNGTANPVTTADRRPLLGLQLHGNEQAPLQLVHVAHPQHRARHPEGTSLHSAPRVQYGFNSHLRLLTRARLPGSRPTPASGNCGSITASQLPAELPSAAVVQSAVPVNRLPAVARRTSRLPAATTWRTTVVAAKVQRPRHRLETALDIRPRLPATEVF